MTVLTKFWLLVLLVLLCTVALFLQACAVPIVPVVAPIAAHPIPVGINDGFHGVLPPEIFAADCPSMIRTPQLSGAALSAFLTAAPIDCPVLALVETPDVKLVEAFARERPAAIELGNELELPPFELTPSQYGDWIASAAVALRGEDYQGVVVLGGVYALTPETKTAIRWGLDSCIASGLTCRVGVHLYDASDDDLQWLRNLGMPIWVTEVGFPTRCDPARVRLQTEWLAQQIARFSTVPFLERVFIYQRGNGPSCSDLDTFGIDGKPAAALLSGGPR
jgi:hypothetical protein